MNEPRRPRQDRPLPNPEPQRSGGEDVEQGTIPETQQDDDEGKAGEGGTPHR